MGVLLFTHKIDIDGMGSAILAKKCFDDVCVEFLETFEVDDMFEKYQKTDGFAKYDYIFITDICPSENIVSKICSDENLKNKVVILDHHKLNFEKEYPVANIRIKNEKGLCCGTSLFYEYLLKHNFIKSNDMLKGFVELTRQYDTYEWKDVYNNLDAKDLNILFEATNREFYIQTMLGYLEGDGEFKLKESEVRIVSEYKSQLLKDIEKLILGMKVNVVDGLKVAVISSAENRFRNEIADVLKTKNYDIEYLAMVISDRETISLRSIKESVDVSDISNRLGGKGHKKASSVPKTKENLKYFKEA